MTRKTQQKWQQTSLLLVLLTMNNARDAMLKRMLVGLVLVCGFGIGAIDSFAFDTAKNLEKEAQLEAKKEVKKEIKKEIKKEAEAKLKTTTKDTKSEPNFDLPKKDAKGNSLNFF